MSKNLIQGVGSADDPAFVLLDGVHRPFIVSIGAMMAFQRKTNVAYEAFWADVMRRMFERDEHGNPIPDDQGGYRVSEQGVSLTEVYTLLLPFFEYGARRCNVPLPDGFDLDMLADWINNDSFILQRLNSIITMLLHPEKPDIEKNLTGPAATKKTPPGRKAKARK